MVMLQIASIPAYSNGSAVLVSEKMPPRSDNTMTFHNAVQGTPGMSLAWGTPAGQMIAGQQLLAITLFVTLPNGSQVFFTGQGGRLGHAKDSASVQALRMFFPWL
ncbi:hypothetical protein DL93DRAFT_2079331 [Clavulina sp. PMI_390]|nr:hypothetical protein DL93DRAFT_2079331 [Clavulina sp. PMI_390]